MKKILSVFALGIFITGMMVATAFARGGHRQGVNLAVQQTGYTYCPVEGCDIADNHQHRMNTNGSQGGYEDCNVYGCAASGLHEHGGCYYYSENNSPENGFGRGCCRR